MVFFHVLNSFMTSLSYWRTQFGYFVCVCHVSTVLGTERFRFDKNTHADVGSDLRVQENWDLLF